MSFVIATEINWPTPKNNDKGWRFSQRSKGAKVLLRAGQLQMKNEE